MGSYGDVTASSESDLVADARSLIQRAVRDYDDKYGCGTMSCAAYDTAWVSLVTKTVDGNKQWLFPECFQHLLATQAEDGSWTPSANTGAQIDGILNTAAPLLALKRHHAEPLQLAQDQSSSDLALRIELATSALRSLLASWDVSGTDHVGFEIILPAMLDLLEKEDSSLVFDFDGRKSLMKIRDAKMSRFRPEFLYSPMKLTSLHSLEAFIGKIDFDRVAHHKVNGSMLGSPSSTAAYLMHTSRWDDESEAYLRAVIQHAAGQGTGGMPSAFPSMHFEFTWILSTLLRAGFTPFELDSAGLTKMTDVISCSFKEEGGVLGFAPYFQADVDDTAKAITSLTMLGKPDVSARPMTEMFETDNHFLTYPGERDASFTANCNVLIALLHQSDVSLYSKQILKIASFLCNYWWKSDGKIRDKWNTCYLYPSVLFVEALVDLLAVLEKDQLPGLLSQDLQSRIAVALFQACVRPLLNQEANGSWNQSVEETAYGILILTEARRICFLNELSNTIDTAIDSGVAFVRSISERPLNYIWIEKVSYASPLLTDSYLLAALKAAATPVKSRVGHSLAHDSKSSVSMLKRTKLFQKTPLFREVPEWELRVSLLEAKLFEPLLRAHRLDVFPRREMEEDKYFDVIPFTWTSCNNRTRTYASASFLYDMMTISFLNYQADEFMEAVAGPAFPSPGRLVDLRQLIRDVMVSNVSEAVTPKLKESATKSNGDSNGTSNGETWQDASEYNQEVYLPLSRFVRHVLEHPSIQSCSAWDREVLRAELQTFLLAHVAQTEDNLRVAAEHQQGKQLQQQSASNAQATRFFNWVRTTSADHTSCPYSFAFVSCLMGASMVKPQGNDCWPTTTEKYLAAAACQHLATMCRMYNDLGSVARDRDEGNLNSVDFVEFGGCDAVKKKEALFGLAEYERHCFVDAFARLADVGQRSLGGDAAAAKLSARRRQVWAMFCDVTDLYGQIYVVKDIASRMVVNKP